MFHTHPGRRVALVAAGLLAGLTLAASPAGADHTDPTEHPGLPPEVADQSGVERARATGGTVLSTGTTAVVSTKRKKLSVQLTATRSSSGGDLTVNLGKAGSNERHSWLFEMPTRDLVINSKGGGTLRTSAVGPYGQVNLKIVPQKEIKKEYCKGVLVSRYRPVIVRGAFVFETGSAWGNVGRRADFRFADWSRVTWFTDATNECSGDGGGGGGGGADVCAFNLTAYAYAANTGLTLTRQPDGPALLLGYRFTELARPAGALRIDASEAVVDLPELTMTGSEGGATLTINTGRPGAKGTAVLTADTGFGTDGTCGPDDTPYRSDSWPLASYANGSTALQLVMTAFGNLAVPDADSGAGFQRKWPL